MPANAVIGSLRVNLGMDSAEFQNGAKRAQSTLGTLDASIKSFAAGAVAALSFGAVTAALKSSVNHMDELGKAAQKIGIPVEQLSGLEYAARLADVSLGDLQSNLSKFNRALGEIAGGGKNDAGAALKAIGVSALDANGKLRPTSDLIGDIAEKFSGYRDGAEKSALAMAIFGKSGADMIPLLNGGRDAIQGAADQAERFGLIVDKDAARAAEQFNDNLTALKGAGEGLTNQVAQAMLPALVDVTNAMVSFAENGVIAEQVATALEFIMREVARFVVEASAAFEEITIWVDAAGKSFDALTSGDFSGVAGAWTDASTKVAKTWEDAAYRIKEIYGTVQHSNALLKQDLPTAAKKVLPPAFAGSTGAGRSGKAAAKKPADEVKETTVSLYDMDLAFAKVADTAQRASGSFSDTMQDAFGSWIDQAIDGSFRLQDSLKGLLSSLTKLALNNVMQSLFSKPAGGVGGGVGGGLGSIVGKLFGFAKGGTILPGGHGGIDSQLVAFRKSPNERVDITKPGQTLSSGGEVKLTVNNYAGVDVKTSRGPDGGTQIDIRKIVADVIAGGGTDKAMRRFGLNPSGVTR